MSASNHETEDAGEINEVSVRNADKNKTPWINEEGEVTWSMPRILIAKIILTQQFEGVMGFVIVFNIGLVVWETDETGKCYPDYDDNLDACPTSGTNNEPLWLMNFVLLILYTVECLCRLYIQRPYDFFRSSWNHLDFFIVLSGWVGEAGEFIDLSFLKIFRIARLMRAFRVLISIRELYLMLHGFYSAMLAIFWGSFLLFILLAIWSIILVEWVHPVNVRPAVTMQYEAIGYERGPRAFGTVANSVLTLFQQIITGDSWGLVSIPVIEEEWWTAIVFILIVMTISLGVSNLILFVIVECATQARLNDQEANLRKKEEEVEQHGKELFEQCKAMDTDGGGTLCLEELLNGYDNQPEFANLLKLMDVERDELKSVFKILDTDGSGDVSYDEFCKQLHKIRSRDTRTMITFMRVTLSELKGCVDDNVRFNKERLMQRMHQQLALLTNLTERVGGPPQAAPQGGPQHKGLQADNAPPSTNHNSPFSLPAPPMGTSSSSMVPSTVEQVAEEIARLRLTMVKLAALKRESMKKLEEQAGVLDRHAQLLAAVGSSLPGGGARENPNGRSPVVPVSATKNNQNASAGMSSALLQKMGDKLCRLRDGVDQQLTTLALNSQSRTEDESATLAQNTELLSSVGELLRLGVSWSGWPEAKEQQAKSQSMGVSPLKQQREGSMPTACCRCTDISSGKESSSVIVSSRPVHFQNASR